MKNHLPLWSKVCFVDWYGVLSNEVFWSSILSNINHPYYTKFAEATDSLFSSDSTLVGSWMRGNLTANEIVESLDLNLDRRCKDDYVLRRLKRDCRQMGMRHNFFKSIGEIARDAFIVVATDNMDCFVEGYSATKLHRAYADDLLCSSEIGVLKGEDPYRFFGPWLANHDLNFSQSLLIDDNVRNCQRFIEYGGAAVIHRDDRYTLEKVGQWVNS